jgi:hypothetical protein
MVGVGKGGGGSLNLDILFFKFQRNYPNNERPQKK